MSNIQLAQRFIEAIDSRDFSELEKLMSADHVFSVNDREFRGADELRSMWEGWWRITPDLKTELIEAHEVGERLFVWMECSGSKVADPLTGAERDFAWSFPVAVFARVEDGLIAQWCECCDSTEVKAEANRPG